MATAPGFLNGQTLDNLLFNLDSLKNVSELSDVVKLYLNGDYRAILRSPISRKLFAILNKTHEEQDATLREEGNGFEGEVGTALVLLSGMAALDGFLQAHVTGPAVDWGSLVEGDGVAFRERCLRSLDVDGVSVYQYIPHVELFCLAKMVFTVFFPRASSEGSRDCKWMRVRVNAYHQRLLSGLSAGRLDDSTMLQDVIERDLKELDKEVLGGSSAFGTEEKVQYLLEKAQIYIMQGLDIKARENVRMAKTVSGFSYALSGALGKRTKFQQNDISQLVVFAKSKESSTEGISGALEKTAISNGEENKGPKALDLNDDTLLESIEFARSDKVENSALPPELKDLNPNEQPQLKPLDQIILLTEATVKDSFSPVDKLKSEEILPYAVRVLSDKPTNWQIYTQALLVRSRIESHRSRTQERSVLQLQVIVDQIIADTQEEPSPAADGSVPEVRVTQFLPRAKATESAPVVERLRYIYPLNSPTRWEVETELAYAWSGAGSFFSALEIFKRLKLWAEVALCFHSVGQEDKARQIVRRQLYHSSKGPSMDSYSIDSPETLTEKWEGEIRSPPPPHSPRLWCILGDLDNDPACWDRAWEISNHRYARAQRTLGEYYVQKGDLEKAREAYNQATIVNRQNADSWSRLGALDLKLGNWDGAIVAFQQSIMIDEESAHTYSNLGSALLSKHGELVHLRKAEADDDVVPEVEDEDAEVDFKAQRARKVDPRDVLVQALTAYKRAAGLAQSSWQIWDNVMTISLRLSPPSFSDLLLGLKSVIRIRSPSLGEEAIDIDILRALVQEVVTRPKTENGNLEEQPQFNGGKYIPPRGTLARAVIGLVEDDVVGLITKRSEIWVLVEKLALYQKDYAQALSCAEKAYRIVTQAAAEEWLQDKEAWKEVVEVTDNLVSAYENYGAMEVEGEYGVIGLVEKGWKMKARSAVRGVMGKAKDSWEGSEEWQLLENRLEELKSS